MKNIIKENLTMIISTLIIVLILSIVPFYNIKNTQNQDNESLHTYILTEEIKITPKKKSTKEAFAKENNVTEEEVNEYKINKKYTNLSINKDNTYINVIVSNKTKDSIDIYELINDDMEESFNELIKSQTSIKYPAFIANVLNETSTNKSYEFNDDGIIVHFSNYITSPVYSKPTNIVLTCSLLNTYINYECKGTNTNPNPNEQVLDPNKKTIAMTFDDGPNKNTKSVINTLSQNHMNATFFMVGSNIKSYPETVKKVLESGNEIGSHSYSHKMLTKSSKEELNNEIEGTNNVYREITNKEISLLRPPYGSINEELKNTLPYSFILWSVDPEDWKYRDSVKVSENVLNEVEDGDIVLLHDIHFTTAEALKIILPELYIRDYQVVTVTKLAELKGKSLEKNIIYRNFK